jgi:hypothetical protein
MIPFRSSKDHIVGMELGKPCMPAEASDSELENRTYSTAACLLASMDYGHMTIDLHLQCWTDRTV